LVLHKKFALVLSDQYVESKGHNRVEYNKMASFSDAQYFEKVSADDQDASFQVVVLIAPMCLCGQNEPDRNIALGGSSKEESAASIAGRTLNL